MSQQNEKRYRRKRNYAMHLLSIGESCGAKRHNNSETSEKKKMFVLWPIILLTRNNKDE